MPEAVIVATARSPIGRAFKGSLREDRPDDLGAQMVRAALAKVPSTGPPRHRRPDARLCRTGRHVGLQPGPRRRRARWLRPPARHHGEPLLLLEPADHADGNARDQGGRGRRLHLGRRRDRQPSRHRESRTTCPTPATPSSPTPKPGPQATAEDGSDWTDPRDDRRSCPTSTSPWARPRRTSPS